MLFLFILLTFSPDRSPFKTIRLGLFDSYQTYWPRERKSAPAVIVAIDETSLNLFGQWPWPRTRLAELLDHVISYHPAAVGVDIIMSEPDRASPSRMADSLPQISPALRQSLKSLPDNDLLLAAALAGKPVVLGAAGFDLKTPGTASTMRSAPVVSRGGDAGPHVRKFSAVLKSLPVLGDAASSQALLSADLERGVVRRVPMVAAVGDVLVPALSIEMLRVAGRLPAIEVQVGTRGITAIGLGDIQIPTEANGEAWVHFAKSSVDRYISAADLLAGRVHPDVLERKLVLIGLTGVGLLDYQTTPCGEQVPGIEVHAQLIENIFDGSYLRRPSWMAAVERGILLLGGILLLLAVPALKPRFSIALAAVLSAVLFAVGILLYRTSGILFDATSVSIGLNAVFGTLLCSVWIETDRKRVLAQKALQEEREAAARVAGELEAARRIQMGSLPRPASAFPGEKRFELDALLEPAREVGGDLYDFYMLDDRRLFFIVGDVAGKGLPASLFMVMTKSLTKSILTDARADVGRPLNRLNRTLCAENPEMLFVTAFAAILDVESGVLHYCIAGHDAPWRIDAPGRVGQLEGEGSPPLGVMEDADYPMECLALASGDGILVLTDGITEAMNPAGELYGERRVPELLQERRGCLPVSDLLRLVRNDVQIFVDSAEQSDDLTLLVLRWHGPRKAGLSA
ncbi:MAG: CHASE2 domain-containing protein [Deltaproteobacteria bacterium]|nr:CHASE2 domain-containing protein [Deltaproteobacteria bacterium]